MIYDLSKSAKWLGLGPIGPTRVTKMVRCKNPDACPLVENDDADPDPDPAVLSLKSLRRQSNRMRRTSKTDMILDALKEQIELCPTDIAVLQWTQDNLFAYAPGIPHPEAPPPSTSAPESESSLSPEEDGPPTMPPRTRIRKGEPNSDPSDT
ncbi:hypothetical protein M422DRAFT_777000 [Sphaerobolus stellatus SS14]|nr:hypothetical protein M422DRAFT_777000 [Sphaerobolus stellatus SS14]